MVDTRTPRQTADAISALEQEYGVSAYEAPEGVHHIQFSDNTGVQEGTLPRMRFEMQIVCGPLKGQKMNLFQGFFASPDSASKKPIEERRKGARSFLVRYLGSVSRAVADSSNIVDAWRQLPIENNESDTASVAQVEDAMADIGYALQDVEVYVKAGNTENGPTFKFLRVGDPTATCECILAAHSLDFLDKS